MSSSRQAKTIEQVPTSTLLHFSKKKELEAWIGPKLVDGLRNEARKQGTKTLTKKFIAQALLDDEPMTNKFLNSEIALRAYDRYVASYDRLQNPAAQEKRTNVRQLLAKPRRQVKGCLATRLEPQDFDYCLDHYDDEDEDYEGIDIVPKSLRSAVYERTGSLDLAPRRDKKGEVIKLSSLPKGLFRFYVRHPERYMAYLAQLKNKAGFVQAMKKRFDQVIEEKLDEDRPRKRQRSEMEQLIDDAMPEESKEAEDEDEEMEALLEGLE